MLKSEIGEDYNLQKICQAFRVLELTVSKLNKEIVSMQKVQYDF